MDKKPRIKGISPPQSQRCGGRSRKTALFFLHHQSKRAAVFVVFRFCGDRTQQAPPLLFIVWARALTWRTILATSPGTPTFPATQQQTHGHRAAAEGADAASGRPGRPRRRDSDLPQAFVEDALGVKDLLPHGAQLLHVCPQPDNKPARRKTAGARSQSAARSRGGATPLPSFLHNKSHRGWSSHAGSVYERKKCDYDLSVYV